MIKEIKDNKGFTLIELLVVIAILAIITLLAVPKFLGYVEKSKIVQIQNDVKTLEDILGPKIAMNEDYFSEKKWTIVDNNDLDKHQTTGSLFDKKGNIDDDRVNLDEIYYEVPSDTFNSKLKGKFYTSQDGKVYYSDKSFEKDLETKVINLKFDESIERDQIQTFTVPKLVSLESISIDNGKVEVLDVNGDEVTVRMKNGEISNRILVGGELTPEEIKEVEGHISEDYNENGFSGKLEKYLYSGEFISEDTKYVTGQTSANYNNDGYSGTLSSYVYSGSYTPSHSRTESMSWQNFAKTCSGDISAGNQSYNSGGYSGTLFYTGCSGAGYMYWSGTVTRPASDTRVYRYQGNVTKPAIDTREYRYKGTVVKPELDTRTYNDYYKYEITVNYK